jgi:hypothetical protein
MYVQGEKANGMNRVKSFANKKKRTNPNKGSRGWSEGDN